MSDSARQHTAITPLERALRERLGLLGFALNVFPQSENRETVRVVINAKGCADHVFGMYRGRERTYREVYARVFGCELVGGPL